MPIVGARLCDKRKLTARRMAILGAELIRLQIEFSNCVGNYRRIGSSYAQIVVVHAVDHEVVFPRASSPHRSANAGHSSGLRNNVRSKHSQVQGAPVQSARSLWKIRDIVGIKLIG